MRGPQNPRTNWVLTLNNWTQNEYEVLLGFLQEKTKWSILAKEVGASGTPHLQGALSLKTKIRFTGLTKLLKDLGLQRTHLEEMKGTIQQARNYCIKDGDFVETGEMPATGLDRMGKEKMQELLLAAKAAIDEGASWHQVQSAHFLAFCRSERALREYWNSHQRRAPRMKPRVEVIWGHPGTGKTRYCHDVARIHYDDDVWIHGGGNWFDGYEGQQVAIFDDYYGCLDFGLFLKVLDRYKCQVPVKGAFVPWNPRRIFITSNTSPSNWYGEKICADQYLALVRRIDRIDFVTENIYE